MVPMPLLRSAWSLMELAASQPPTVAVGMVDEYSDDFEMYYRAAGAGIVRFSPVGVMLV
jgi:hypothetical protein